MLGEDRQKHRRLSEFQPVTTLRHLFQLALVVQTARDPVRGAASLQCSKVYPNRIRGVEDVSFRKNGGTLHEAELCRSSRSWRLQFS